MVTNLKETENVKYIFDQIASYYVNYFGDDWEFLDEIEAFSEKFKNGSTILDLGCGSGYITNFLKNRGLNAIGIDFSAEMINIAKEKFPDIDFKQYDFLNIENYFEDNSVDGVIAIYSLYFIPRIKFNSFLQSLSKVLKKGGKFLFVTQVGDGESYIKTPLMNECNLDESIYLNCYKEEELKKLLKESGFTIDYFDYRAVIDEKEVKDTGRYIVLATKVEK